MIRRWWPYVVAGVLVVFWIGSLFLTYGFCVQTSIPSQGSVHGMAMLGTNLAVFQLSGIDWMAFLVGMDGLDPNCIFARYNDYHHTFFIPELVVESSGKHGLVAVSSHYVLVFAIALVVFTRWRRRSRPGCCPACGYDLCGNPDGACPECGEVQPKMTT